MNEKLKEADWSNLAGKLAKVKSEAENVGRELERWLGWLDDVETKLSTTKPTGSLPETAQNQMDDFCTLKAEIEENTPPLEAYLRRTDQYLEEHKCDNQSWMQRNQIQVKRNWNKVKELCKERERKLISALDDAVTFDKSLKDISDWLDMAKQRLACAPPISCWPGELKVQINEQQEWCDEISIRKIIMAEQQAHGTKLRYYGDKSDATVIRNSITSQKHRFEKVASATAERTKHLCATVEDGNTWLDGIDALNEALDDVEERLAEVEASPADSPERRKEHRERVRLNEATKTNVDDSPATDDSKEPLILNERDEKEVARITSIDQVELDATKIVSRAHALIDNLATVESWLKIITSGLASMQSNLDELKVDLAMARTNLQDCFTTNKDAQDH